jgi:DNA primase catalytic core
MGLHKLTAGDGYTYLIRQVAASDSTERGYSSLGDYYAAKGESPGTWIGNGLQGLGTSGTVTESQMRNLFGQGIHPDADRIQADLIAAGTGAPSALAATKLGSAYRVVEGDPAWRDGLTDRYQAYNTVHGRPENAPVPAEERTRIRTELATEMFTTRYGRPPAHTGELTGFLAQVSRPQSASVAGFDLTFSPVKSVSALWAVAPRPVAEQIEAAHHAAVLKTVDFLESEAAYTRMGTHGVRQVEVTGLVAAMFTHRDSRAGDPDLHTHVAVSNKVQTTDGRWLALDGRMLYRFNVAASEFYNTQLEAEITQRVGGTFLAKERGDGKRPVRELAGVDERLTAYWSSRREAIEAVTGDLAAQFVTRQGRVPTAVETLRLAQQATLATRQAKHEPRSLNEQRRVWRAQALRVLGGETQLAAMLRDVQATVAAAPVTAGLVDELAAQTVAVVSNSRARWYETNLLAEAIRQVRAAGIDPTAVNELARLVTRRAVAADHCVPIGADTDVAPDAAVPGAARRSDGTSVYRVAKGQRYTSPAVLDAEQRLVAAAGRTDGRRITPADVQVAALEWSANNGGRTLNHGQAQMVNEVATSGRRVHLALAPAGTGKTTVMGVLARAWQGSGGHVVGLAPQASAAEELHAALHQVHTDTLDKLVHELSETPDGALPGWVQEIGPNSLVIVDEAGLAATPKLDTAVGFVTGRGGRVLLVGDDRQRAAAGAGGVLRDIDAAHGSSTLVEVLRFTDPTEGHATLAVREGETSAVGFYTDRDRLHAVSTDTGIDTVYRAWAADVAAGADSVMMAPTLEQVAQLNARARADRQAVEAAAGIPAGPELTLTNGEVVSAGDTVVTKRNARSLSLGGTDFVQNNHRWTVQAVHPDGTLGVRMIGGTGREIRLPAWYVDQGNVRLGYAHTLASCQGITVGAPGPHGRRGTAHALLTPEMTRNEAYVALSRAVTENHAYLMVGGGTDPHQVVKPEAVQPETLAEQLTQILGRDGSAVSASTEIRDALDPHLLLGHASDAYADAIVAGAESLLGLQRLAQITDDAERAVPGVTSAPAWSTLLGHLALLEVNHRDPVAELAAAAGRRELGTARDTAAVLDYRLDPTGNHSQGQGPLPWLPAIPAALQELPEWDPYLTAWANRVTDHAGGVRDQARAWSVDTAPAWAAPYLTDRQLVVDLALWRASQSVPADEIRPAGESPRRIALRERHRKLSERCARVAGNAVDGADRWSAVLAARGIDLTGDDFWPVLAGRLNLADAAGLPVPALLDAAAGTGPLPAQGQASALWWRLHPHLGAVTSPVHPDVHRVRPVWTDRLAETLGQQGADRITRDRLWPVLVGRVDTAAAAGADPDRLVTDAAAMLAPHLGDVPEHSWATALLWHVGTLVDPAPVIPGIDSVPPDPADIDRTPPPDLYLDAPPPDPRAATTDPVDAGDAANLDTPVEVEAAPPDPQAPVVVVEALPAAEQAAALARARAAVTAAWDYYQQVAPRSWVPGYVTNRGLDPAGFGYAPPGWTRTLDHLRAAGFTDPELLAAGLARPTSRGTLIDPFRNRAVLPIHDTTGQVVAFVGRAHPDTTDPGTPKYVNSATTDLFSKTDLPFGLNPQAVTELHEGAGLAIVEGPMDALAVNAAAAHIGRRLVAVAPLGTALTRQQLATLNGVAPLTGRSVLVALDNDPAGRSAAATSYQMLQSAGAGNARIPSLPAEQDPAGVLADAGVDALVTALGQRRPLADLVVDQVMTAALRGDRGDQSPEARLWALDKTAQVIARMPSEQRARQAVRTARALDLDAFRVLDRVQSHVPYDPTPRGPLSLPKPPRVMSQQRRTLQAITARIEALATDVDAITASVQARPLRDRDAGHEADRSRQPGRDRDPG